MAKQLKDAMAQMQAARARYQQATTRKAMREAAADLEFWSNKAAMLEVMAERE